MFEFKTKFKVCFCPFFFRFVLWYIIMFCDTLKIFTFTIRQLYANCIFILIYACRHFYESDEQWASLNKNK